MAVGDVPVLRAMRRNSNMPQGGVVGLGGDTSASASASASSPFADLHNGGDPAASAEAAADRELPLPAPPVSMTRMMSMSRRSSVMLASAELQHQLEGVEEEDDDEPSGGGAGRGGRRGSGTVTAGTTPEPSTLTRPQQRRSSTIVLTAATAAKYSSSRVSEEGVAEEFLGPPTSADKAAAAANGGGSTLQLLTRSLEKMGGRVSMRVRHEAHPPLSSPDPTAAPPVDAPVSLGPFGQAAARVSCGTAV